jgi:hypothetical protein
MVEALDSCGGTCGFNVGVSTRGKLIALLRKVGSLDGRMTNRKNETCLQTYQHTSRVVGCICLCGRLILVLGFFFLATRQWARGWSKVNASARRWQKTDKWLDGKDIVIRSSKPLVIVRSSYPDNYLSHPMQAPNHGAWRRHELADAVVQHYVNVAVAQEEPDDSMWCTAAGMLDQSVSLKEKSDAIYVYSSLDY